MKKHFLTLLSCLLLGVAHANAMPFAKGDPKAGKALHDKSCVACHDSKMYTRTDRKVKTPAQLAGRISGCNANTGAGWFPEEELNVGAYLNQQFYKFK
ncbi:MAG: cytochrome c [Thiobacillaceae bacterium]